jgi:hypothetical protein
MEYKFSGNIIFANSKIANASLNKNINFLLWVFVIGMLIYIFFPLIRALLKLEPELIIQTIFYPQTIINLLTISMVFIFLKIVHKILIFIDKKYFFISKDTIKLKNKNEEIILTKENINQIRMDENNIYIYCGLDMAYIINIKFLKNKNVFKELKAFIKENYDTEK